VKAQGSKLKAQSSRLKAESSKLKAQSSRLKARNKSYWVNPVRNSSGALDAAAEQRGTVSPIWK
jgi:uncharacterized protein (DUF3084 family)